MTRLPQEGKDYFATTVGSEPAIWVFVDIWLPFDQYLAHFPGFVTSILGPTVIIQCLCMYDFLLNNIWSPGKIRFLVATYGHGAPRLSEERCYSILDQSSSRESKSPSQPHYIPLTFWFPFRLQRQEERLHVHRPVMKTYSFCFFPSPQARRITQWSGPHLSCHRLHPTWRNGDAITMGRMACAFVLLDYPPHGRLVRTRLCLIYSIPR